VIFRGIGLPSATVTPEAEKTRESCREDLTRHDTALVCVSGCRCDRDMQYLPNFGENIAPRRRTTTGTERPVV
jgi:hypothetical protein